MNTYNRNDKQAKLQNSPSHLIKLYVTDQSSIISKQQLMPCHGIAKDMNTDISLFNFYAKEKFV